MTGTRRLAAILAADVAGYARLIGADEEGTLDRLRSIRADLIDPKINENRGRIVKTTGDGFLVEFSSVVDALRCATQWQHATRKRGAVISDDNRIEFRIGVHQGDIVVEDDDIFGDGVNIAARLEGLADPGGICVSARVQEDVAGKLDLSFEDLGEQSLKNIARPVRVYRVRDTAAKSPSAPVPSALPLPDKPSIAVLPFQNMSGDPEQEYFADGMVEEITTALSKLRWFFVIARNSCFTYKGRAVDVKQVARELGVRYVLEGSVRKGGNRLRITAQLVEAETGNHVWAERFDRDLSDIFAVQDEITERVVAAIEPELYAAEYLRSRRSSPENLDAWECAIRAHSAIGQGTQETAGAEQLCRRAIAIAPSYAQAHSLLAWVLLHRSTLSGDLRSVSGEISAEIDAALALDDRDPWAHLVQSIFHRRSRRFAEAVRSARRALELNPNFALAHAVLAMSLAYQGAYNETIDSAQHALRLSPFERSVGTFAPYAIAIAQFGARRYPECVTWVRMAIEKNASYLTQPFLVAALAMQGDIVAASDARDALIQRRPEFSLNWMTENLPSTGELAERLCEGLRKAGVPEE
jgi:TolB-like protein/class 3 adenylate cyclase